MAKLQMSYYPRQAAVGTLLTLIIVISSPAQATLITLNPVDSGSISITIAGGSGITHNDLLPTLLGSGAGLAGYIEYNSYLIFDLSSVAFSPMHGTLNFDFLDPVGVNQAPLTLYGLDTTTPEELTALLPGENITGPVGAAIFDDLGSGTQLAPTVTGQSGAVGLTLNATALTQIDNAMGLWGLGIKYLGQAAHVGLGLDLISTPRLILSDEEVAIPIPGTLLLQLLALFLLLCARYSFASLTARWR